MWNWVSWAHELSSLSRIAMRKVVLQNAYAVNAAKATAFFPVFKPYVRSISDLLVWIRKRWSHISTVMFGCLLCFAFGAYLLLVLRAIHTQIWVLLLFVLLNFPEGKVLLQSPVASFCVFISKSLLENKKKWHKWWKTCPLLIYVYVRSWLGI